MNNDKENEFDDFFKKGLDDPADYNEYREKDWDSLEQMLNEEKKRKGIVYWLPVLSGVAAMLLLFVGWWVFQTKNTKHNEALVKKGSYRQQPNNNTKDTLNRQVTKTRADSPANYASAAKTLTVASDPANIAKSTSNSADYAKITKSTRGSADYAKVTKATTGSADYAKNNNHSNQRKNSKLPAGVNGSNNYAGKEITNQQSVEALSAVNTGLFFEPVVIGAPSLNTFYINSPVKNPAAKNKTEIKKQGAFRPQYALTVLAAPDLNGVGSFQQGQVGTNLGLVFSARVLKKLTISTGAIYSDKPYTIASQEYHTPYHFPVSPQNISAVCHMLDVPLNVNYQLYDKHQNKIFIGTGLSSYIMLNENYKFNYSDPYYYGKTLPSGYTVPHSDSYFFGVVNLSATYQRQLNSKIALDVQPYYKLPINDLGYGQVRLQSTGVAVGLTWNFNSLSKH